MNFNLRVIRIIINKYRLTKIYKNCESNFWQNIYLLNYNVINTINHTNLNFLHFFNLGLRKVKWLGRCQYYKHNERFSFFLDGAHTTSSIEVMYELECVRNVFTIVFTILNLSLLLITNILTTTIRGQRVTSRTK